MSLPDDLSQEDIAFLEVAAIAFGITPEDVYWNMVKLSINAREEDQWTSILSSSR